MDLNEVGVFIKVVQVGSFSKAAHELGMPNSTVSHKVSQLEKRLGVQLIQRTTRKLHITPAGQEYFARSLRGMDEILAAESELLAAQGEPSGLLRLTAPVELGSSLLPKLISGFIKKFPKVGVETILTDRKVDLLGEGVDLAIRAGELKDSSLIAKRLGSSYFAAFASPKYLKANPPINAPKDLVKHNCVKFTSFGGGQSWSLVGPRNQTVHVNLPTKLMANDLSMIKVLATNGDGVALLPTFFCYPEVAAGKLVRVLPDWTTTIAPVHFVYPAQKFVLPKLSSFIEFGTDVIRESLFIT
jgi:DNA-binding transcriptional LysR family regulator